MRSEIRRHPLSKKDNFCNGVESDSKENQDDYDNGNNSSYMGCFKLLFFRSLVVILVIISSFLIPNLNLMMSLVGTIFGTIITLVFPILFYNRAYSSAHGEKLTRG